MSQTETPVVNQPTNHGPSYGITWDDGAILDTLGNSAHAVHDLLKRYDMPVPSMWAIYQWTSRRRISGRWRPMLVYALMRERLFDTRKLFSRDTPADLAPSKNRSEA